MNFDVIIIGSGAGGGMAALELCQQGFKVALVERGRRFDPRVDYIQNYPDWETRDNLLDYARTKEQTINPDYRSPASPDNAAQLRGAFNYHRVYGLGGSTLHYQGEAHRYPEHSFGSPAAFDNSNDWPIDYRILEPYYQRAEKLLGVAGDVGNPFKSAREPFPTPAHPLSPQSQILAKSANRAGMSLLPNTLALPSRSVDGRLPCQQSGGCNYGCVFKAKSSIDQAIIPVAEKTGNLTILTNTRATKIRSDAKGNIGSVQCMQDGQPVTFTAKKYVLAMGAVETPRLLLHSSNSQYPNGLANRHDQVGRYFMETITSYLPIALSSDVKTYNGPPLDSRIWDFSYPREKGASGFVLGASGYLTRSSGPIMHALKTPGIGRANKQKVRDSFGKNLHLFGIADQQPSASNRLFLSDKLDKSGVPKVNIHCTYSEKDKKTIRLMQDKLLLWAKATDLETMGELTSSEINSQATHVGGTCRMGTNPQHSVTDAFGKIHGIDNGYITDASVLPTQGSGNSPSLTIQSLALRTAEKIAPELRN